jgi:hypothetical protein
MTKLWRALAVGAAGALIIGVAVAFAGVPHLSIATGDVSAGTTCVRKCTTTTPAAAKTADATAAASAGTQIVPAIVTVDWAGTQMSKTDLVTARLQGTAKWACFNGGSNIPAESNNQKSARSLAIDLAPLQNPRKSGNTSGTFTIDITPAVADTGLACQGTQVIALYSLTLDLFRVDATSDQGTSSVTVNSSTIPYCRDPGNPNCFS